MCVRVCLSQCLRVCCCMFIAVFSDSTDKTLCTRSQMGFGYTCVFIMREMCVGGQCVFLIMNENKYNFVFAYLVLFYFLNTKNRY